MRYLLFTVIGLFLLIQSAEAQPDNGDSSDVFNDIEVTEPEIAPGPGDFGIYGGPAFEYFTLKTVDLDPDLDYTLFGAGGYGYVILANWVIGGGGGGVTADNPNERYDRFTLGYGGFLTGYDRYLANKLSGRLSLLVGGGGLEMVKKLPGIPSQGDSEFLERFRKEEFFLLRGEASLGYKLLPFLDVRAAAAYWFPIGGENVSDLRQITFGLHLMFGFRNNSFM